MSLVLASLGGGVGGVKPTAAIDVNRTVYTYIHTYIYICVCTYTTYVCVVLCMYVYIYIYIYICYIQYGEYVS